MPGQSKTEGFGSTAERAQIRSEVTPVNNPKRLPPSTVVSQDNTTHSFPLTSIPSEKIKALQQKLSEAKKECILILSKQNVTNSDLRRMDQIKREMAMQELYMNSIMNDPSSSAPYVSYDHLNNLPASQMTMGADTYQMYTPEDLYSYPVSSTSLSSSMQPNHHYDESYMGDQPASEALVQAALQQLGPVPDIAPATNGHYYDENGDFFGRGQDTFVGPKANREE